MVLDYPYDLAVGLHGWHNKEGQMIYRGKGNQLVKRGTARRYELAVRKERERKGLSPKGNAAKKAAKRKKWRAA